MSYNRESRSFMSETTAGGSSATWATSQCPFAIEYVLLVIDDIRLAVVDAFFSLPRGGAEIGGILLGRRLRDRVTITGYRQLDCEHAFGPSFQLSANDHRRLAELIAEAKVEGEEVVGWYHSHTRSEVFLSEADLAIHDRYFPEAWQVALVMKPSTFQPPRCGFFFREVDGTVHGTASYKEFVLEGGAAKPVPAAQSAPPERHERPARSQSSRAEPPPMRRPLRMVDLEATEEASPRAEVPAPAPEPEPPPPPQPAPEPPRVLSIVREEKPPLPDAVPVKGPERANAEPPAFGGVHDAQEWPARRLYWLAAGVAAMAAAYAYQRWSGSDIRPADMAAHRPTVVESAPRIPAPAITPPATTGLNAADRNGQLQIRWDPNAPVVQAGTKGTLVIRDGGNQQWVALDVAHLRAGEFDYGRQSARVDFELVIQDAAGKSTSQAGGYLGSAPPPAAAPKAAETADAEHQKERDALTQELAKVKADLAAQTEKTRRAERAYTDLQRRMKQEQARRRMSKQAGQPVDPLDYGARQ